METGDFANKPHVMHLTVDDFTFYYQNSEGLVLERNPQDIKRGDVLYAVAKNGNFFCIGEEEHVPEWHKAHSACYINERRQCCVDLFYEIVERPLVKKFVRNSWDEYFLNIAKVVSSRSTCLRRRYGAVIVKDFKIVSTGYNGAPRNYSNCCDIGECEREKLHVPKGERYELCKAVHAEQNALISCSAENLEGSTIYIYGINCADGSVASGKPCLLCGRMLVNGKVHKAIFSGTDGRTHSKLLYTDDDNDGCFMC